MSTLIISKTKVSVDVIRDGLLKVSFDTGTPANTTARAEISSDKGFIQLKLLKISTDPEVSANIYVVLDGVEKLLLSLDEKYETEIDVEQVFGEILIRRIILEGVTKYITTSLRNVTLRFNAIVYDFR
jgi:hypothetical protein